VKILRKFVPWILLMSLGSSNLAFRVTLKAVSNVSALPPLGLLTGVQFDGQERKRTLIHASRSSKGAENSPSRRDFLDQLHHNDRSQATRLLPEQQRLRY
jgi:hypothetical protein